MGTFALSSSQKYAELCKGIVKGKGAETALCTDAGQNILISRIRCGIADIIRKGLNLKIQCLLKIMAAGIVI